LRTVGSAEWPSPYGRANVLGAPQELAGAMRLFYQQVLEGEPALVTLETLAQVFSFLRQALEPSSGIKP
jgi:hypothetical protein